MDNGPGRVAACIALMAIVVSGGTAFGAPGALPAAHGANANLFVSAEDPRFGNRMAGPQVVEVVVRDPDIGDTGAARGEPDVTVNGRTLRMVQATDGSWYGYFADRAMASRADKTTGTPGAGLDFGSVCTGAGLTGAQAAVGVGLGDADGVAVPAASCTSTLGDGSNNVVREAKGVNTNVPQAGQIGIDAGLWPFIQLYALNQGGDVVVQYHRGGGTQAATLAFEAVDGFAGLELDRARYPTGAQVHATIADAWLNIDPTDEDSWTFGALDGSTYYQVFDENGAPAGDAVPGGAVDVSGSVRSMMCGDGCILLIDPAAQGGVDVLTLQATGDSPIRGGGAIGDFYTSGIPRGAGPVTFTEQGPSSGVFASYDESDQSTIVTTPYARRGTSAVIDYAGTPATVLVGSGSPATDTVAGRAFSDTDRDGSPDPGEPGMPGIGVLVYDYVAGTGHRLQTGDDGAYSVPGILPGQTALAQVVLPIPPGHLPSGGIGSLFAYTPFLEGGSAARVDFPLHPVLPREEGTVAFEVYDDLDGDGHRDAGEPGVPGATVFTFELLTHEADVRSTGPAGSTIHSGLIPDVVLAQISYSDPATGALLLPDGFARITTPNGGAEYITVAPGTTHTVRIGLGR